MHKGKRNKQITAEITEKQSKTSNLNSESNIQIHTIINQSNKTIYQKKYENLDLKNSFNEDENVYDDNGNITKKKKQSNQRIKTKKEPIPMKLRALPQSFWQQPNNTASQSPGTVCPALPLICKDDLPLESRDYEELKNDEMVTDANTDLLFSLFRVVEDEQRRNKKVAVIRRGRPKKSRGRVAGGRSGALKDDDPCLVNTATETLLPLLPERAKNRDSIQVRIQKGEQALAMVSTTQERPTEIKQIQSDHNYSHLLSEVVVRL